MIKRLLFLPFIGLALLTCSDDDCPVCPDPGRDTVVLTDTLWLADSVGNYNFYLGLWGGGLRSDEFDVYVYNTHAQGIVDTIFIPDSLEPDNIEITIGERYLIGSNLYSQRNTFIMDLTTREIVRQFDFGGVIEVSPNGKYIVVQEMGNRIGFHVLDAHTLDEIPVSADSIRGGHFHPDGNLFVGKWGLTIKRFDIAKDSIYPDIEWSDGDTAFPSIYRVMPTADPNKLFLFVRYGYNFSQIVSYYIDRDSTGFHYRIGSPSTRMAITPDNRTLVFTDPINFDNYPPYTTSSVFFADIETEHVYSVAPSPGWMDHGFVNSKEIAMTPDGKIAMFSGIAMSGGGMVGVMSLTEHVYIQSLVIDTLGGTILSVACPKGP